MLQTQKRLYTVALDASSAMSSATWLRAAIGLRYIGQATENTIRRHPIMTCIAFGGIRGIGGDFLAQRAEGRPKYDFRRSATWAIHGMTMALTVSYAVFSLWVPRNWPAYCSNGKAAWNNIAKGVALDSFLISPLYCIPLIYVIKEPSPAAAWKQIQANWAHQSLLNSALWAPTNAFAFWLIPPHLRVPYFCIMGLLWAGALSFSTEWLERRALEKQRNARKAVH